MIATAVQVGHKTVEAAGHSHGHETGDNTGSVAVHQIAQITGQPGEGVYQFGQILAANIRMRTNSFLGHSEQVACSLCATGSDSDQSHDKVSPSCYVDYSLCSNIFLRIFCVSIEPNDPKRTSIYDIDVEIDDSIRDQMKNFLNSSQSLVEIGQLDTKINELVEQINTLRVSREFFMSFSEDPQDFINKWLISQSNDLKTMLDLNGNPEDERRAQFYHEPWTDEAVHRYFYNKVQQKRAELEQVLGIRN